MAEGVDAANPKLNNPYYCQKCKKSVIITPTARKTSRNKILKIFRLKSLTNRPQDSDKLVCPLCSSECVEEIAKEEEMTRKEEEMTRKEEKMTRTSEGSSVVDDTPEGALAMLEGCQTKGVLGCLLDYLESEDRRRREQEGEEEPETTDNSQTTQRRNPPSIEHYSRASGMYAATQDMSERGRRNMALLMRRDTQLLPGVYPHLEIFSDMLLNEADYIPDYIPNEEPVPKQKIEITNLETYVVSNEEVAQGLQCTVCMEDYNVRERAKKLNCGHIFHEKCLGPWFQKQDTCPSCRTAVDPQKPKPSQGSPRA